MKELFNNIDHQSTLGQRSIEEEVIVLRGQLASNINETAWLTDELKTVREELKTVREELRLVRTELKASNEDLDASFSRNVALPHPLVSQSSQLSDVPVKDNDLESNIAIDKRTKEIKDSKPSQSSAFCFSKEDDATKAVDSSEENTSPELDTLAPLSDCANKASLESKNSLRRLFLLDGPDSDPGEEEDLETDIYSLLMISTSWTKPFFYAIMVASSQFFITILILIDLLVDERVAGVRDNNPLNVPSKVEWPVVCAQFLSLIIAFVTVDDIITSMKMFISGYDPNICKQNPGATYCKFLFSNFIRFLEGMGTIFVSVVIIVVSSNVLEIFMNFAAVAFVSTLDNLAFQLAQDGLCGESLRVACEKVTETKVRVQRRNLRFVINVLFVMFFLPFLSVLTLTTIRQNNGYILATTSCKNLDVHFGDEMLTFPADVKFSFEGHGLNKTFPNSKRLIPFLDERPDPLLYQYFSGNYVAEIVENSERLQEFKSRPIYWERGMRDPTSGKFYYCNSIKSWVFTIEALYNTRGAIAEEAKDRCEWGWLMQSPVTDAITLNEAPLTDWNIWTGDQLEVTTSSFSITCSDCKRNSDCGLTHGKCDWSSGTCHCNENRQGRWCHVEKPYCPALVWLNYGDSSFEYSEVSPYTLGMKEDGTPVLGYERAMYVRPISPSAIELMTYMGERWFRMEASWEDIFILRRVEDFHAYWGNAFDKHVTFYSDRTFSHIPIGFTWHRKKESKSKGSFGLFGASYKVNGKFECIDVKCRHNTEVCGDFGRCVKGKTPAILMNAKNETKTINIPHDQCECKDDYGGYYCENHPREPYSIKMYNEYIADPIMYAGNHADLEYLKYWV